MNRPSVKLLLSGPLFSPKDICESCAEVKVAEVVSAAELEEEEVISPLVGKNSSAKKSKLPSFCELESVLLQAEVGRV